MAWQPTEVRWASRALDVRHRAVLALKYRHSCSITIPKTGKMGWEKKTREDPPKPAGETRGYKGHMEGGEGGGVFLGGEERKMTQEKQR